MPRPTKANGHAAATAVREELLARIAEQNDHINDKLSTMDSRLDGMQASFFALGKAYAELEIDMNNHLAHMGWGQVGSTIMQILGFLAVLAKLMGWF